MMPSPLARRSFNLKARDGREEDDAATTTRSGDGGLARTRGAVDVSKGRARELVSTRASRRASSPFPVALHARRDVIRRFAFAVLTLRVEALPVLYCVPVGRMLLALLASPLALGMFTCVARGGGRRQRRTPVHAWSG